MPKAKKGKFNLKSFIKNLIRRASYKYSGRTDAINAVRIPAPANWPNTRVKWVVPCAHCKKLFELKQIEVDHIQPIIPVTGWPDAPKSPHYMADGLPDLNTLIYRTFVSPSELQVLCKPCHKVKSDGENAQRRAA